MSEPNTDNLGKMGEKHVNRKPIWSNRDWLWLCIIQLLIIVLVIMLRLSNNGSEIVNIISIGAGISSIILAFVAIVQSSINSQSASDSLARISEKVGLITEIFRKIEGVEKAVEAIKNSTRAGKNQSKSIDDQKKIQLSNLLLLSGVQK